MEEEYLKRWRLILGGNEADGTGITLTQEEQRIDQSLEAVYNSDRRGGLGSSAPKVSRWLGDIREFFPQTVVQVIQRDAIKRLNITSLLTEKEMLETVVPDVHLVATLMSLSRVIPEKNKEMARQVVRKVVDELLRKLSARPEGPLRAYTPGRGYRRPCRARWPDRVPGRPCIRGWLRSCPCSRRRNARCRASGGGFQASGPGRR